MVIGELKNKELNRWLTAFLVLAVFSTFLVNIVFAQINMQELNSSDDALDSSDDALDSSDDALRMRVGDTLDLDDNFGDGYILIIKQIDPDNNEVLMELQLNGNAVDEKRITENEKYEFSKRKDKATFTIHVTVLDVSQDAGGEYTDISIEYSAVQALSAHNCLTIYSIPEGAAIYIDGGYLGKTSKTGTDIPVIDLSTHYVLLKKQGYNSWKGKYKFPSLDSPLEMRVVLNKTENSKFTPIETADISTPTETVPTKTETSPTETKTVLTKIGNSQIETEAIPTANPNKHTPGFSGVTALIILLIGICLRKKIVERHKSFRER